MKRRAKHVAVNDDDCVFQIGYPRPTWENEEDLFSHFSTPCRIKIVANLQVEVVPVEEGVSYSNENESGKWESRNILFVPVDLKSYASKYMDDLQKRPPVEHNSHESKDEEKEEEIVEICAGDSSSDEDQGRSDRLKCFVCGKLMWAKHFKEHMLTHSSDDKKKCIAKKPVKDVKPEQTNPIKHSEPESCEASPAAPEEGTSKEEQTGYICKTCGVFLENLEQHIATHTDIPDDTCAGCGKVFKIKKWIKEHTSRCRGQPNCKPCDLVFETRDEFNEHVKLSKGACHSREKIPKRYPCHLCDHVFTQERRLTRHMVVHTGEKEHLCDLCGTRFGRADYVLRHKKTYPDGACIVKFGKKRSKKEEVENSENSGETVLKVSDTKKLKKRRLLEVVVTPCM